ncbi:MAG: flagellar motor protein PomA [Gammaproteobacteria bacterium]|nr:flagellar motor protein PomA [Gammaproteobacteria bacterium]MDH3447342.1 flagellar motor protein PomA [Gammaproteobacteria bacterium]
MDIATLVGFLLAYVIIGAAISLGGPFILFINAPSLLIVIGGTFAVTLMRVTLNNFLGSFKIALKGFFYRLDAPQSLIEESVELANVARKEGILALEGREISNTFLDRGIGLCIDGHAPEVVKNLLAKDINMSIERHTIGADMFKAMAVYAPAMGMIGTLIGLVQMLANMSDPAAIGPAMAVALLTTLYGAVIANAFASPLAEKLILISGYEKLNKDLILESITGIQEGTNPRVLKQLLNAYLPESKRQEEE